MTDEKSTGPGWGLLPSFRLFKAGLKDDDQKKLPPRYLQQSSGNRLGWADGI
jgi:hypothetical protein